MRGVVLIKPNHEICSQRHRMVEKGYSWNMRCTQHGVKRHTPDPKLTSPRCGEPAVRAIWVLLQRRNDFLDVFLFRVQSGVVRFAPVGILLDEVTTFSQSGKQDQYREGGKQHMAI